MSYGNGSTIYVILEGLDPKNLRFVVAYWDFQEACSFCRTALMQLTNKLPTQHTIRQQQRNHGHAFDLICESDQKSVAGYIIQKGNVV